MKKKQQSMIEDPKKMQHASIAQSSTQSNTSYRANSHYEESESKTQERVSPRNNQGRTKLVFKKRERNERSLDEESQTTSEMGNFKKGIAAGKKSDQFFPLDVAFKSSKVNNLLFRLDIQEYQVDESDLKQVLSHILAGEEKNALIFTFDITNQSSFRIYLKRAIRELIFSYEELNDNSKESKLLPFLILGMKKDVAKERSKSQGAGNGKKMSHASMVNQEEVNKMMEALKKHMKCEVQYISGYKAEDITKVMKEMFKLTEELFFHTVLNKKQKD